MTPLTFISSEHPSWDALHPTYINGIYFDGMTEDHFSYDCCGLLQGTITPGIFDCTIHDYPNPCKAFIWHKILLPSKKQNKHTTNVNNFYRLWAPTFIA